MPFTLTRKHEEVVAELLRDRREVLVAGRELKTRTAYPGQYLVTRQDGSQELMDRDELDVQFDCAEMEMVPSSANRERVTVLHGIGKYAYWASKAEKTVVADSVKDPTALHWAGVLEVPNFDGARKPGIVLTEAAG